MQRYRDRSLSDSGRTGSLADDDDREDDMEDDDEISYEFVIRTNNGKMIEIEVDAVTGKLAGEEEVLYRIGN